jgi:hypothetical protein
MLPRRIAAALLVAAALACVPRIPAVHAQDAPGSAAPAPETVDTGFGVVMAVSCGGGARAATLFPNPVTIAITLIACVAMLIDALYSADHAP